MTPITQASHNDCFEACVASISDVALADLPARDLSLSMWERVEAINSAVASVTVVASKAGYNKQGLLTMFAPSKSPFFIAWGPAGNDAFSSHAVVCKWTLVCKGHYKWDVVHDPAPSPIGIKSVDFVAFVIR